MKELLEEVTEKSIKEFKEEVLNQTITLKELDDLLFIHFTGGWQTILYLNLYKQKFFDVETKNDGCMQDYKKIRIKFDIIKEEIPFEKTLIKITSIIEI